MRISQVSDNINMDLQNPNSIFLNLFWVALIIVLVAGLGILFFYFFLMWIRNKSRESVALNSTLLQVTVPRDNEIKIDAAEQMFSALYAIRKTYSSDKLAYYISAPSFI